VSVLDVTPGRIVYSKAGRDAGKRFIVLNQVDDAFVLISDGNLRRIEKPKKKKIKHLALTGEISDTIREKVEKKQKISNSELRKALEEPYNIEVKD
jgi:large subunit ribosomal protein L14e